MAKQPFESRIQDLVYNVDVGIGLRLIKSALYFLFLFTIILIYTANQFKGLRDAEAMDYGQVARNIQVNKSFTTQNVRPASIWLLTRDQRSENPQIFQHPELVHAPLYPALLSGWLRITGARFTTGPEGPLAIFQPEYRVMLFNHLFAVLAGIMLYIFARRLFDTRIALLGLTLYFLSDTVWRDSLSGIGLPLLTFWTLLAIYFAVLAGARTEDPSKRKSPWLPVLLSLLACLAAFHTRYAAIALVPGIALYLGLSVKPRSGLVATLFIVLFLVGTIPWITRNMLVSGAPLGLAPYTALNGTELFPENSFERQLNPNLNAAEVWSVLQAKFMTNIAGFYRIQLRSLGEGLLTALFLTTFFYRFVRQPVHLLRWCIALSLLLLLLIGGFFGESTIRLTAIFWPVVIVYALAFFVLLLDRLQLTIRLAQLAITSALVILSALPLLLTLMPPRAAMPYPPYAPGAIIYVSNLLRSDELMCTDMPWATAWYGGKTSVLLPHDIEQFYDINDYMQRFSGLYFSPITRDQPYIRSLRSPRYRSWLPILEGRIPGDFPLTQGIPLFDLEQLFLSDRARWAE